MMDIDNRKDKIVVTSDSGQAVIYKETASGLSKAEFEEKYQPILGDATEEVRKLLPTKSKKKAKESKENKEEKE